MSLEDGDYDAAEDISAACKVIDACPTWMEYCKNLPPMRMRFVSRKEFLDEYPNVGPEIKTKTGE